MPFDESRNAPSPRPALMALEAFEPRTLMAVTVSGNVLVVIGTTSDDEIRFSRDADDPNRLIVDDNGVVRTFALKGAAFDIAFIDVNGDSGSDLIEVDERNGKLRLSIGIDGGDGDDTLTGGSGNDTFDGGDGSDEINGGRGQDRIDSGNDDNTVRGGTGDDLILTRDGEDSVLGGNGSDRIETSDGDDFVDGGSGADDINGGAGNDSLEGGDGRDIINGAGGDDDLRGGYGVDFLFGSDGADFLAGYVGADQLFGGRDNDTLEGGNGNDSLDGGSGRDRLLGDSGSDVFGQGRGDIASERIDLTEGEDSVAPFKDASNNTKRNRRVRK